MVLTMDRHLLVISLLQFLEGMSLEELLMILLLYIYQAPMDLRKLQWIL